MREIELIENLIENFLASVNHAKDGQRESDSTNLVCKFKYLYDVCDSVAILVKAGNDEQYHAFYLDKELIVCGIDIMGGDFQVVPEDIIEKQMTELESNDEQLYNAVMNTNEQRALLVTHLAKAMKDSCEPNLALILATNPHYLSLIETISFINEFYGKIYFYASTNNEYVTLEFLDDLENSDVVTYS
ncbi:hypothetical protein [Vibrio owensii]|uniref:hypothetical protein n=1 Tax=Vibrio owensii TaxID=696485 RepID=UPI0005EF8DAB|nr:hypothetical protein [Vibrio owensii]